MSWESVVLAGWVYMMSNHRHGTLYIGVTSDLEQRVLDHRGGQQKGFVSRYTLRTLVWHERHPNIVLAIRREKALKRYSRQWKLNLIETLNPEWDDLFDPLYRLDNPFVPHPNTRIAADYVWGSALGPGVKPRDDGRD